ncbi:MAG TPA: transposase, partial [Nevskiaceae bacterium]|nr:transposase [Nevskiaceae bacterium]
MRKATYRMYPSTAQFEALDTLLGLHQRVYNSALEARINAYKATGKGPGFAKQCKALTQWRHRVPALKAVNAQSLQVTLKRLSLAYAAFFRRVAEGAEQPGFPRFKSLRRFSGWGYKTHGDGWTLHAGEAMRHGYVRLAGVGNVKLRGQPRTAGSPTTAEVLHKDGRWYLSVTLECTPARQHGARAIGLDWGLKHFATTLDDTGSANKIANPRFQDREHLQRIKTLQQAVARKLDKRSHRRRRAVARLSRACSKIARQRKDFLHKESAWIVAGSALIETEELNIAGMTATGGAYKHGLNRSILDTAPSRFLALLHSKAEEAGCAWCWVPTRKVKPTQTCSHCGTVAGPRGREEMDVRTWTCPACHTVHDRDVNSAAVALNWALTGSATGQELKREPPARVSCRAGSGSGFTVSNRETPSVA